MIRYGVWHGGYSYSSSGDWTEDLELWNDLESAQWALQSRYRTRGPHEMVFVTLSGDLEVTRRIEHYDTTLVDESSYIDLFNIESGEPYLRLTLGPRGGVRRESF